MSFAEKFTQNFIDEQRYMYLVKGLGNTVVIPVMKSVISKVAEEYKKDVD